MSLYVSPHALQALSGVELIEFQRPVVHAPALRAELLRAVASQQDPVILSVIEALCAAALLGLAALTALHFITETAG